MKKILILAVLITCVSTVCVNAWVNCVIAWYVVFNDGRVAKPILTQSYTENWSKEKDEYKFYSNSKNMISFNLKTISDCATSDNIVKIYYGLDGGDCYITLKNVKSVLSQE